MLRREEVERIKEQYPKGTPIRLYSMEGEQTVPPGSRGVVDHVDDIGQIHMKWENGSSLALNVEEDRFDIITQQDELCEKKEQEFIDKINEILNKTNFLFLNTSCNTGDTTYAAETLLAMHQAFEEVYGEGYVDESYGMIMMPAVVRGRESGIQALALVTLDLESSGEHWENGAAETYDMPVFWGDGWTADYYSGVNNYQMPAVIRLDLGYQFEFTTGIVRHSVNIGMKTLRIL